MNSKHTHSIDDDRESKRRRLLNRPGGPDDNGGGSESEKDGQSYQRGNSKSPSHSSCPAGDGEAANEAAASSSESASLASSSGAGTTATSTTGAATTTTASDSGTSVSLSCSDDRGKIKKKKRRSSSGKESPERDERSTCSPSHIEAVSSSSSIPREREESSASTSTSSRVVERPHPNDVLCGRGPGFYSHRGNITLRKFVHDKKAEYILASTNHKKTKITNDILERMRRLDPPARFLERVTTTAASGQEHHWIDTDARKQFAKVSQSLREGASTMRPHARKALGGGERGERSRALVQAVIEQGQGNTGTGETEVEDLTSTQLKSQCELIMDGYALESERRQQQQQTPPDQVASSTPNNTSAVAYTGTIPPFSGAAPQALIQSLTPSLYLHAQAELAALAAANIQNQLLMAAAAATNFNMSLAQAQPPTTYTVVPTNAVAVLDALNALRGTSNDAFQSATAVPTDAVAVLEAFNALRGTGGDPPPPRPPR